MRSCLRKILKILKEKGGRMSPTCTDRPTEAQGFVESILIIRCRLSEEPFMTDMSSTLELSSRKP